MHHRVQQLFGIFLGHFVLLLLGLLLLLLVLLLLLLVLLLLLLLLLLLVLLVLVLVLLVLLLVFQHLLGQGQVVARLVVGGVVAQRFLVHLDGLLIFLCGVEDDAHVMEYLRLASLVLLNAGGIGKFVHRFLRLVLPKERVAQVETGDGRLRIGIQSLAVIHLGVHIDAVLEGTVSLADIVALRLLCKGRDGHQEHQGQS